MRFRIFIGLLVTLILAYVVFWFVLADRVKDRVLAEADIQRDAGATIKYDNLEVRGFPYRLEFALTNLEVARDEENGVSWDITTPELVVVMQPWNLTHSIVFARDLTLTASQGKPSTVVSAHDLRASVITNKAYEPLRVAIEAGSLTALGEETANSKFDMSAVEFHWRRPQKGDAKRLTAGPFNNDRVLEPMVSEWAISGEKLTHIAFGKSPYGDTIQHFNATIAVHGKLGDGFDRATLGAWRDEGGTLALLDMELRWGALDLDMNGSVSLDDRFQPLGAFTAEVKGYEPVIDHLEKIGDIGAKEADTVKATLNNIAKNDTDGRLTVPIAMQSGRLFIGPLPVANLPPVVGK